MKTALVIALLITGTQQALAGSFMRQACQVIEESRIPMIAQPGVVIIEQTDNTYYDGPVLLAHLVDKEEKDITPFITEAVSARVRFFQDENFGVDLDQFQNKANLLIESNPTHGFTEYPGSIMRRHRDTTQVIIRNDGSFIVANPATDKTSSLVDYQKSFLRSMICGPRYLFQVPGSFYENE